MRGADHFSEGAAAVKVNGKWLHRYAGADGDPAAVPGPGLGQPDDFQRGDGGGARTETGTGVIDRTGRLVIPAIFRSTEDFSGGLILAKGKIRRRTSTSGARWSGRPAFPPQTR